MGRGGAAHPAPLGPEGAAGPAAHHQGAPARRDLEGEGRGVGLDRGRPRGRQGGVEDHRGAAGGQPGEAHGRRRAPGAPCREARAAHRRQRRVEPSLGAPVAAVEPGEAAVGVAQRPQHRRGAGGGGAQGLGGARIVEEARRRHRPRGAGEEVEEVEQRLGAARGGGAGRVHRQGRLAGEAARRLAGEVAVAGERQARVDQRRERLDPRGAGGQGAQAPGQEQRLPAEAPGQRLGRGGVAPAQQQARVPGPAQQPPRPWPGPSSRAPAPSRSGRSTPKAQACAVSRAVRPPRAARSSSQAPACSASRAAGLAGEVPGAAAHEVHDLRAHPQPPRDEPPPGLGVAGHPRLGRDQGAGRACPRPARPARLPAVAPAVGPRAPAHAAGPRHPGTRPAPGRSRPSRPARARGRAGSGGPRRPARPRARRAARAAYRTSHPIGYRSYLPQVDHIS